MSEHLVVEHQTRPLGALAAFFWGLIPGVLGGAALLWLTFVTGCLDLQQQRTLAQRMDDRVGVVEPLKNPVKLWIQHKGDGCIKVTRAYIDADSLVAYVKKSCSPGEELYPHIHWKAVAPDGTVIRQNDEDVNLDIGDTVEQRFDIPEDDRIVAIYVWVQNF